MRGPSPVINQIMTNPINVTHVGLSGDFFALLLMALAAIAAIFWMVVAWRAMRAHENLVESIDRLSRATMKTK
jgi:uncharacterized membrane protein